MGDNTNDFLKQILNGEIPNSLNEVEMSKYKTNINILNKSNNENPKYESSGASGFDFRANLDKPVTINSLERTIIPTGLFFELPVGFELQVRPRSGLAAKNGITVLNSPGTVDVDYTGEVKIILVNLSNEPFTINNGDRIAQGVFATVTNERILNLNFIDKIEKVTKRNESGFGSTGLQ